MQNICALIFVSYLVLDDCASLTLVSLAYVLSFASSYFNLCVETTCKLVLIPFQNNGQDRSLTINFYHNILVKTIKKY